MTWLDALEIVIARTRHERYRWLCSEANPDAEQRDAYRRHMLTRAGHPAPAQPPAPIPAAFTGVPLGRCCG